METKKVIIISSIITFLAIFLITSGYVFNILYLSSPEIKKSIDFFKNKLQDSNKKNLKEGELYDFI